MKIIFLNAWKGKVKDELLKFIDSHKSTTDIFCFQEGTNLEHLSESHLQDFECVKATKYINENGNYNLLCYVSKNIRVLSHEILFANDPEIGLALKLNIQTGNDQRLTIYNVHGLAHPGDKLDIPKRIEQSETIIANAKNNNQPTIIGGDFNLLPSTESIKLFEQSGYQNLINDFAIETTRNKLAWERYADNKQFYADYAFTSPGVKTNSFTVPDIEISDHLPLILDVDIMAVANRLPTTVLSSDERPIYA